MSPREPSASDPSRRRISLTGRAAVLAVVVAALGIALAAPVRQLIGQRAQISGLRAGVSSEQQQVAALQATQKLWANPSYVAAQAQERLHYVQPGKVPVIALAPTPTASPGAAGAAGASAQPIPAATAPWYAELWTSVRGAGQEAPKQSPTPTVVPTPPS